MFRPLPLRVSSSSAKLPRCAMTITSPPKTSLPRTILRRISIVYGRTCSPSWTSGANTYSLAI
nr:MAG TPA: hypothetical protein [Caudoviricetes sp.]